MISYCCFNKTPYFHSLLHSHACLFHLSVQHRAVNAKEKWDSSFVHSVMQLSIFMLQSSLIHLPLFICLFVCSPAFPWAGPSNATQPFNIRPQVYTHKSATPLPHSIYLLPFFFPPPASLSLYFDLSVHRALVDSSLSDKHPSISVFDISSVTGLCASQPLAQVGDGPQHWLLLCLNFSLLTLDAVSLVSVETSVGQWKLICWALVSKDEKPWLVVSDLIPVLTSSICYSQIHL